MGKWFDHLSRVSSVRFLALGSVFFFVMLFACWGVLRAAQPVPVYEGKGYSRLTFDRTGRVLDIQIASDGRYRVPIDLARVPEACVDAALHYEDKSFFHHPGVNPLAMLRAIFARSHGSRSGGSTITMQLVRLRTRMNTKSFTGKLRQSWEALVLERHMTKREILGAYFNFAPYGGGLEGIAAASAVYFRKIPERLTQGECAALAVIPQDPSARFAFRGDRFEKAFTTVSARMQLPAGSRSINFPTARELEPSHLARHLTQRVLSGGGAVSTTIDRELQVELERLLTNYVAINSALGLRNGSVLVANGRTGAVRAYLGSRELADASIKGFVDGVVAKRSPGSLLKPFVYAKAIDEGLIVPDSVLTDIPVKLASYEPENFERDFLGPITARRALVKSRNIPALLLNTRLTGDGLYDLLKGANVPLSRGPAHYGAAVVLGGIEISLLNAVRLYTAFVADGVAMPLQMVEGQSAAVEGIRLFSAESAYLTREMLEKNPAPRGYSGRHVAWKTGTSNGARDAWAVGVVGDIVVGVWLGNFDGVPNPNFIGRDLAGPLLFQIVERLKNDRDLHLEVFATTKKTGLNIRTIKLCPESGMLHTPNCPHAKRGVIIPGVSPIKSCDMHRVLGDEPVYSSEIDAHFQSAGLRFSGALNRVETTARKTPPRIISPEEGLEYRAQFGGDTELELRASVDGEARKVFWYVDGDLIGETEPGRSLFWKGVPGTATIRAVDSFGASDAVRVRIVAQEN